MSHCNWENLSGEQKMWCDVMWCEGIDICIMAAYV